MEAGEQAILLRLIEVAKVRGTTFYSDIAPLAGLDLGSEVGRIHIAQILDKINRGEASDGRPLLSAIVLSMEENRPGEGFFRLAEQLGMYRGGDWDTYWLKELQLVHDYWSSH